ncbi:MAG TPA: DUF4340 domain-containing protein [Methylomirabilota bacterium]|nr:DUF4340 domain-containing protein [Methylomirabilota bacterium]
MNTKSTGWLVAAAAALFAFIIFFERHLEEAPTPASMPLLGEPFRSGQTTSIQVRRTNQTIRAELRSGAWHLTLPLDYPAQPVRIEGLLSALAQLNRQFQITPGEISERPEVMTTFGLENPHSSIILEHEGTRTQILVGGTTPLADRVYLQVVGNEGVYLADASLLDLLPSSAGDWRSRRLVNLDQLAVNRIAVTNAGPTGFELLRDSGTQLWRLNWPLPARANNPKVQYLLLQLAQTRVESFVSDDPNVDLEPYGLEDPVLELVLAAEAGQVRTIQFGSSPPDRPGFIHARRSQHANIVLVPLELRGELRASYNEYRDPFLVPPMEPGRIEIERATAFSVTRTNDSWRLSGAEAVPADEALVKDLVADLKNLSVSGFVKDVVTDFAGYGLDPPALKVRLWNGSDVMGTATSPSPFVTLHFSTNREDRVFVRRTDEDSVYAIQPSALQTIPRAPWQIRDRQVWSFSTNAVRAITLTEMGRKLRLERNDAGQWTVAAGYQGSILNTAALQEALYRLGTLRAVFWTARGEEALKDYGFDETDHTVELEIQQQAGTETRTLRFGWRSGHEHPYAAAIIDGEWTVFEFPVMLYHEFVRQFLSVPQTGLSPSRSP